MLSLFFVSVGVVSASDASDTKNFNSEDINNLEISNTDSSIDSSSINTISSDSSSTNSNSTNSSSTNIGSTDFSSSNSSSSNSSSNDSSSNDSSSSNHSSINSTVNESKTNSPISSNSSSKTTKAAAGDEKPVKLTQSQILTGAKSIYSYILANNKLPNYVTVAGYKFSMEEFMYLMSKAVVSKYTGSNTSIIVKYGVKNPKNPSGTTIKGKINSKYYAKYAKAIHKYISKYGIAPNYVSTAWGKMPYQTTIYMLSRILTTSGSGNLPGYVAVSVSKNHKLNKYVPKYSNGAAGSSEESKEKVPSSILNSKYNGESLTKYLSASKNCQSNDAKIIAMAKKLTKNCNTELEKATAIFNAVRDKVSYSFYYNTKKGAKNTMESKSGNCVDKTHLLISLLRAVGIPARYVNGEAKFTSGSTYGHVWAQVLIGDTWVVADTTSSRNSFGVVNNWYASSAKVYGYYSSISF